MGLGHGRRLSVGSLEGDGAVEAPAARGRGGAKLLQSAVNGLGGGELAVRRGSTILISLWWPSVGLKEATKRDVGGVADLLELRCGLAGAGEDVGCGGTKQQASVQRYRSARFLLRERTRVHVEIQGGARIGY